MATLKAALDALDNDSERWNEVAAKLDEAGKSSNLLVVASGEWPDRCGLESLYRQVEDKVTDLLVAGRNEALDVGVELKNVKSILESADEQRKTAIAGLWDYE